MPTYQHSATGNTEGYIYIPNTDSCRVSDLYRMTKLNVVNEAIEYIPKKTKEGNPVTVRVPLNDKAKEILERHKEYKGKLLPFISEQKYNDAIKKIFKLAGVDRIVTILDPLTHNEVNDLFMKWQAAIWQGVLLSAISTKR